MAEKRIGILGATSLVGDRILAMDTARLMNNDGVRYIAFTRQSLDRVSAPGGRVDWRRLGDRSLSASETPIECWISLMPIWMLPEYFVMLESFGARRIVVLSSTSLFTKTDSSDPLEQEIAVSLKSGEDQLMNWAEQRAVSWIVLRPTLIYGMGRDRNIASIARFIRRLGFFPLPANAEGLRQPIHAEDVATACLQALSRIEISNRAYNISGGETLTYREMVRRVFAAMHRKPRLLSVPMTVFRLAVAVLHLLPRFRRVSIGMAERMSQDLAFDHSDAQRDIDFRPGQFQLDKNDVGGNSASR